jgi:hypothetical protein
MFAMVVNIWEQIFTPNIIVNYAQYRDSDALLMTISLFRHKFGFFPRFKTKLDLDYLNQTGY